MIIVGTSLAVSPANILPVLAKQNGAALIEINPEQTAMSEDMDLVLRETSANTLPSLISLLE